MLIPERSQLYSHELKVAYAELVREEGSAIPRNSRLKMVYRKYTSTQEVIEPRINLVFIHGTGMNKGIWHYHIDKLFELNQQHYGNRLSTVVAVDCVNHCESAFLNRDKLGFIHEWRDSAKDIVKLVTNDEADVFVTPTNKINIIIGHSMGGFVCLYTGFLAPDIFNACVPINPVCYVSKESDAYNKMFHASVMNWYDRGYMRDTFEPTEPSRWYDEIEQFFRTKSFFANFHPSVLQNMLSDEIQQDPKQPQPVVKLHTTVQAQFSTYLTSMKAMRQFTDLIRFIQVPVYRLLSEYDLAIPEARVHMARQLQKILINIDLPNEKHLVNGENPDLVIHHLDNILTDELKKYSERDGSSRKDFIEDHFSFSSQFKDILKPQSCSSLL